MRQDAALKEGVELVVDEARQFTACAGLGVGDKAGLVLLHRSALAPMWPGRGVSRIPMRQRHRDAQRMRPCSIFRQQPAPASHKPSSMPNAAVAAAEPAPDDTRIQPLLQAARAGDGAAAGELFALLYRDLRRLAHARLHSDGNAGQQLNTTMLVHESYERLAHLSRLDVADRGHFMAYASRVMRSVIVDFAREHLAERRGGGAAHVTLTTGLGSALADPTPHADPEVLRVHEAIEELGQIEPRLAQVVEMRYYGGLSNSEIAAALDLGLRTVERDWERARLYLYSTLRSD